MRALKVSTALAPPDRDAEILDGIRSRARTMPKRVPTPRPTPRLCWWQDTLEAHLADVRHATFRLAHEVEGFAAAHSDAPAPLPASWRDGFAQWLDGLQALTLECSRVHDEAIRFLSLRCPRMPERPITAERLERLYDQTVRQLDMLYEGGPA